MKEIPTWVLEKLCYYDKRNPDCTADDDEIEYNKYYTSKKGCCCDNCFYGRTKLAEYIIELYETNTTK